jgi:hypothetical protein
MQMPIMVTKIPAILVTATMEEAIGKFMDGMEAQERGGFKELHRLLARLPVPTVKASPAMTHKDALEGSFLPSMTAVFSHPCSGRPKF